MPIGALANAGTSRRLAAKVTTWKDAGPLFYAKGRKPPGSTASLASPVLSVSFVDSETGLDVKIEGLEEPFIMTFALTTVGGYGTCAHWNESQQDWIADGALISRSETEMKCEFTHITSFGGTAVAPGEGIIFL